MKFIFDDHVNHVTESDHDWSVTLIFIWERESFVLNSPEY